MKRSLALTACAALVLLAGCGAGDPGGGRRGEQVKVAGSTTVLPLAQEAAVEHMESTPEANVEVQGGGSSAGITQLKERVIDVANSSRDLGPDENDGTLVDHQIAFDVIAIIVNPRNRVRNLTSGQVKAIFTGAVTNWKEVGGEDREIVVVVRDQASGTREVFDQIALGATSKKPVWSVPTAIESASNGVIREIVASTGPAIGYVSYGYVNRAVRPVRLNGVPPDIESTTAGRYPMARFLHMYTRGEPIGATKSYIDYVLSDRFQEEVVAQEYLPVKEVYRR